ncbi:RNA polymerase II subunit A C-terminal domain phosphatase [Ascosphaera pollenicola]|nr:RNA polymerase II subunit A C-terminal domain phosphatase [Ascosphaera pollenicola]
MGTILKTQYYSYHNVLTGKRHIAAREYSLPANVSAHIDYIVPGVKHLSAARRPLAAASKKRDEPVPEKLGFPWANIETNTTMCSTVMTPACVRALYNIPKGSKAAKGNELGIVAQLDAYSQEDLDSFNSNVAPEIPKHAQPDVKSINGGVAPVPAAQAGIESNLDLMAATPIIWPQKALVFQVDDPVYQADYTYPGFLNNFLDAIDGSYCDEHDASFDPPYPNPKPNGYKGKKQCGVHDPTKIITISYANSEDNLPPSYQTRQCYEWLKLGLQGITVVAASGDAGVQSEVDEKEGCLNNGKTFAPQFPASCPYVTTVGATALPADAKPVAGSEVASFGFASGGGFSNIFQRPSWQDKVVNAYFDKHDPKYKWYHSSANDTVDTTQGAYNRAGRAYPDVAAVGQSIPVVLKGKLRLEAGTSASAPFFASMLSLINEERIAANKSTIGFINPILYANPDIFNDITIGKNQGCGTEGFSAVEGWDPVTGLGTPDYKRLLEVFMKQD